MKQHYMNLMDLSYASNALKSSLMLLKEAMYMSDNNKLELMRFITYLLAKQNNKRKENYETDKKS